METRPAAGHGPPARMQSRAEAKCKGTLGSESPSPPVSEAPAGACGAHTRRRWRGKGGWTRPRGGRRGALDLHRPFHRGGQRGCLSRMRMRRSDPPALSHGGARGHDQATETAALEEGWDRGVPGSVLSPAGHEAGSMPAATREGTGSAREGFKGCAFRSSGRRGCRKGAPEGGGGPRARSSGGGSSDAALVSASSRRPGNAAMSSPGSSRSPSRPRGPTLLTAAHQPGSPLQAGRAPATPQSHAPEGQRVHVALTPLNAPPPDPELAPHRDKAPPFRKVWSCVRQGSVAPAQLQG